jgi:hypothetical protein
MVYVIVPFQMAPFSSRNAVFSKKKTKSILKITPARHCGRFSRSNPVKSIYIQNEKGALAEHPMLLTSALALLLNCFNKKRFSDCKNL